MLLCASLKGLNFILRKLHEEKESHGRYVSHKWDIQSYILDMSLLEFCGGLI